MKKTLAIILALCLGASMLAACGGSGSSAPASASVAGSTGSSAPEAKPVEIRVVTSYGGDDGNRANYEEAVAGYEAATGNTVVDESATSNEQWKAQVKADFQTGSEPDVLFFFTGTDACSLQEVPHYWFEFCILNQGDVAKHAEVPASGADEAGQRWVAGLNTLKEMYEKGYFPANTLTAGDADTFQMMADNKAAFAIDGSWKVGWFTGSEDAAGNVENIDDYTVTYVPGSGSRKATDIVGGISMGYYITEKAWSDPEKRDAAVQFVEYMTTDDMVNKFAGGAPTALKSGLPEAADTDSLHAAAVTMFNGKTGMASAVQDALNQTARGVLFASVKDVVTGTLAPEEAIETALATPLADS